MKNTEWHVSFLNCRQMQYKNDSGQWVDWQVLHGLTEGEISVIDVDIVTNAIRIVDKHRHIAVGCLRFYGHDA